MTADIPSLLHDALALIEEAGVQAALIGGCARNAWAEVRSTKDVDFVVNTDAAGYARLASALEARGFRRATAVGASPGTVPDLECFQDDARRRIDFLFAHTEFEESALSRAVVREPYGTAVRVVTREDLIVYKLVAGRTQDRLDIHAMLEAAADVEEPIDWAYVERWCTAWEALDALTRLRAEVRAPC